MTGHFEAVSLAQAVRFGAGREPVGRDLPEEVPVAIVCNGTTVAVLMATPVDLIDFATGFCFSEGIIEDAGEIESMDVIEHDNGLELRLWIEARRANQLLARRRRSAGPTGCGLCGIESLEEAARPLPKVRHGDLSVDAMRLQQAVRQLADKQLLNRRTRALHAAAAWCPRSGFGLVREDVGRHNALDKLIGGMLREGTDSAVLLLTSRVSIELIQKAAIAGFGIIVAVSVPTALAVRTAETCKMTLIGIARNDGFEVFTGGHRIM